MVNHLKRMVRLSGKLDLDDLWSMSIMICNFVKGFKSVHLARATFSTLNQNENETNFSIEKIHGQNRKKVFKKISF